MDDFFEDVALSLEAYSCFMESLAQAVASSPSPESVVGSLQISIANSVEANPRLSERDICHLRWCGQTLANRVRGIRHFGPT